MPKTSIIKFIKVLNRPVFTTRELSDISRKNTSVVTQSLNYLQQHGVVRKLYRGIWAENSPNRLSPYALVPYLFNKNRVYVSFLSALHLHGVIGQIPQVITLASTGHTRKILTLSGAYLVHRISGKYFFGFDWYKGTHDFLIAEPEKALADCLYLFTKKKRQYGYFPEMDLKKPFSAQKTYQYLDKIPDPRSRKMAVQRFKTLLKDNSVRA